MRNLARACMSKSRITTPAAERAAARLEWLSVFEAACARADLRAAALARDELERLGVTVRPVGDWPAFTPDPPGGHCAAPRKSKP